MLGSNESQTELCGKASTGELDMKKKIEIEKHFMSAVGMVKDM